MQSLIDKVKEDERKMRKADLRLLQEQIQPHFLYNTLDTIVWLIESNEPDEAVTMVVTLSDFFREILSKGKEFISMKEEEKHISSYLQIQEMRYRDILEYEICMDPVLYHYEIPKLTLQPILENSIIHGTELKIGEGNLWIRFRRTENRLIITISDDGVGMDEETLERLNAKLNHGVDAITQQPEEKQGGIALANVNNRIHLIFGDEYGMHVYSMADSGTDVEISIPVVTRPESKEERV